MPEASPNSAGAGRDWVRTIIVLLAGGAMLLPLIWMVSVSFRESGQALPRSLEWVPDPIVAGNYREVFSTVPFATFAQNSVVIAMVAVPLTVAIASMTGFALAQISRTWRLRIFAFAFATMMIPVTAFWLSRFLLFDRAGLIDSRLSLIVPALAGTSPLFILIFSWTFSRVPGEIFESAQLDGASAFRTWLGIGLPLARPTVTAVTVLAFVHYWRDFIEPLLYIQSTSKMTLPLGLRALQQLDSTNWPILMAACVMVTLPIVLVFLAAQKYFLQEHRGSGFLGR